MKKRLPQKENLQTVVIQFCIVFLLLLLYNYLFFSGNSPSQRAVNQYMMNWKVLKLENNLIPIHERVRYKAGFRFGYFKCSMRKEIYYIKKQNKYISILTFENFMNYKEREIYRTPWEIEKIYVNTSQYNNIKYGSIENPVPAFPLTYKSSRDNATLSVPIELIKVFVQQYLKFFMPKEEFKEMFRK